MRKLTAVLGAVVGAVILVPAAFAATATPFGGATVAADGTLTLVSNTGDAGTTNDASGATFAGTGVTTFSSLTTLSTEFNVTDDDCSGGSPRFQVRLQTPSGEKNVFVYLGPSPSFTGCSPNAWIASGNLVGSADGRFDTSQIQAGTQVSTYAQALALVGALQVTGISLVVDSGWAFADKEQTVLARNVKVNGSTFYEPSSSPEPPTSGTSPAQACKKLRTEMGLEAFRMAYGTNGNKKNAFGKCVSKMARMKNDVARAAAVERIGESADRCMERAESNRGKSHGKGKGHGKGHGKAKGKAKHHEKSLTACLKKSV
jgi:hypothetical protein